MILSKKERRSAQIADSAHHVEMMLDSVAGSVTSYSWALQFEVVAGQNLGQSRSTLVCEAQARRKTCCCTGWVFMIPGSTVVGVLRDAKRCWHFFSGLPGEEDHVVVREHDELLCLLLDIILLACHLGSSSGQGKCSANGGGQGVRRDDRESAVTAVDRGMPPPLLFCRVGLHPRSS